MGTEEIFADQDERGQKEKKGNDKENKARGIIHRWKELISAEAGLVQAKGGIFKSADSFLKPITSQMLRAFKLENLCA